MGENNLYNRGQLLDELEKLGVDVRPMPRPSYMKPYPDRIDKLYPFPRGYKVPEFSLFSGEEKSQSTVEHIARFSAQCGEAGAHDFWKLRLFASFLTKVAFTWYSHLSPNSVDTWKDPEIKFHEKFYRAPPDVTLADLARISQLPSESVEKYIDRFRNLRTRCMTHISEGDCVLMVVKGMNFAMREHFEGHRFRDLFELTNRVTGYERLLQEKEQRRGSSKGTYYRDQLDVAVVTDSEDDSSDDEICMAEFLGKKPTECAALRKPGYVKKNKMAVIQKEYSFDLTKADDIFDALLKDGKISLSEGHVVLSSEELIGKDYCKFHNSWRHSTNNCVVFRNVVQKAINEGKLLFPAKREADAKCVSINVIRPNLDQVLGIGKVLEKWNAK
ncbi:uncharacterized protein LOC126681919 [Mercurialis annua]|uniref:uncharacterized protein LOC126681919 n=1 Tax=Mercurialis annua TaxID=3986 RepID=UPI00215F89BA|nr:uncharacterized protein LOC126681919 [Mercurialis annua]